MLKTIIRVLYTAAVSLTLLYIIRLNERRVAAPSDTPTTRAVRNLSSETSVCAARFHALSAKHEAVINIRALEATKGGLPRRTMAFPLEVARA
jgi:hypothetical protein